MKLLLFITILLASCSTPKLAKEETLKFPSNGQFFKSYKIRNKIEGIDAIKPDVSNLPLCQIVVDPNFTKIFTYSKDTWIDNGRVNERFIVDSLIVFFDSATHMYNSVGMWAINESGMMDETKTFYTPTNKYHFEYLEYKSGKAVANYIVTSYYANKVVIQCYRNSNIDSFFTGEITLQASLSNVKLWKSYSVLSYEYVLEKDSIKERFSDYTQKGSLPVFGDTVSYPLKGDYFEMLLLYNFGQ